MTLLEGYFAKLSSYPVDDQKICVSLSYPHFVKRGLMRHLPLLAPSRKLLRDWRSGHITWQTYESRFRQEITSNPQAITVIKSIANEARMSDIRLLCYEKPPKNCHRFILIEMIKEGVFVTG